MKSISLVTLLVVFLVGCNGTGSTHKYKLDTFPQALYYFHVPKSPFNPKGIIGPILDTAIFQYTSRWVFKDTLHNSGGHWQDDTARFGRVSVDTLRDSLRHPMFDGSHNVKWVYQYAPLADSLVQVITILQHKK